MKFKKFKLIGLISIFIAFIFGIISDAYAINYRFDTKCSCQTLSNEDTLTLDLNLVEGYSSYLRLNPFTLKIKFNKELFEFKKIIPSKNIRQNDIYIENFDNSVEIKFNPREPRMVPFFNSFAEILKANFICKSGVAYCKSYFQTEVTDDNAEETVLSKFSDITIKNEIQSPQNNTETNNPHNFSKKYSQSQSPADCHLKSIVPNVGTLTPSFNPNIFKYKMEVPKETQEVYFDIVPISENTEVRVNKHRLGAPGTITYINITSKNQSRILSYSIEVKRSINSSNSETNSKNHSKSSKSSNAKSSADDKSKETNGKKRKSKKRKKSSKHHKNSGSGEEEDDESEEEDFEDEYEENSENENSENEAKNESSVLKNNKIYWFIALGVLILSVLGYLLFKKKSQFSKDSENTNENDINNFYEK